jgi:hypothetical protein
MTLWEIHIKIFLSALLEPNFDGMLIVCALLRIVSDSPAHHTFFPFFFHRKFFLKSSFGTTCSFDITSWYIGHWVDPFRNVTKWSVHKPLCNHFCQQYQFWLCNCKPCVTIWSQISWIVRKDIYETNLFCALKKVLYNLLLLLVVLRK